MMQTTTSPVGLKQVRLQRAQRQILENKADLRMNHAIPPTADRPTNIQVAAATSLALLLDSIYNDLLARIQSRRQGF
jgi:hypothetical protein